MLILVPMLILMIPTSSSLFRTTSFPLSSFLSLRSYTKSISSLQYERNERGDGGLRLTLMTAEVSMYALCVRLLSNVHYSPTVD